MSTRISFEKAHVKGGPIPWSAIRGFNYQPSYGTSGLDTWLNFDAETIDRELERGRRYFPGMNAIRIWLSWEAFVRNPQRFAENFEQELAIADKYDLSACRCSSTAGTTTARTGAASTSTISSPA